MPDLKLKAYVSFKKLTEITGSGSTSINLNGILKTVDLDIQVSGASNFNGEVDVKNLQLNSNGSSRITLKGKSNYTAANASGASSIKAIELSSEICKAKASGASNINIIVNKELSVEASGASSVNYKGEGVIKDIDTIKGVITGYFSIFGNKDSDGDIVMPGAYKRTLKANGPESEKPRILHLFMHDATKPLAKPSVLREDKTGLYFESIISHTQLGKDVIQLYQDKVLTEHSIGYQIVKRERRRQ
jgi:HK97 family phage prohead protease